MYESRLRECSEVAAGSPTQYFTSFGEEGALCVTEFREFVSLRGNVSRGGDPDFKFHLRRDMCRDSIYLRCLCLILSEPVASFRAKPMLVSNCRNR